MEFLDARRLTGPSLLFDAPGSILDIRCTPDEAARVVPRWTAHVERMLAALEWPLADVASIVLDGGLSVGFTAPIDVLYAASAINEWAWAELDHEFNGADQPDFDATVGDIRKAAADEANPRLIALQQAAPGQGATLLWDDDDASLGLGRHSETWPIAELPSVDALEWDRYRDVPVGLVTGTNGKTTTVRVAAHILREAGLRTGMSSTDWIAVDDRIIDRDDWSGPGGARNVLREKDVDAAILETARGGLLRRGLGVEKADAAAITNIASDHLGDFGSRNLDELLHIKWIVSRAVREGGKLVLNADDALLTRQAADYDGEIVWFSLNPANALVQSHVAAGGNAFVLDGDSLVQLLGAERTVLCDAREIPITLGGVARHNSANALAAAALTWSMGVAIADVRRGLVTMSQDDNPGRCNIYEVDGFTVVVDFAHNPQAIDALLDMVSRMPSKRMALCFGQAGDRPDDLIRELARNAWERGLERVCVSELAKYHRGREHGAVFEVIRDELLRCGATAEQIEHHEEEIESLDSALAWAEAGDLVVMIALERSEALYAKLRSLSG